MAKFKLKMNQTELKALGSNCMFATREIGRVSTINELIAIETCERLWTRMQNMYRPDVERYTLRLSVVELKTLLAWVFPVMRKSDEIFFDLLAQSFENELLFQLGREMHVINLRLNHEA
jgi:hypothetical protein